MILLSGERGFHKRGKEEYGESIEEKRHADNLIQRILLLAIGAPGVIRVTH